VEMRGFEPLTFRVQGGRSPTKLHPRWSYGVGVPGLEPGASVLSGLRSNQLS
jgi:hypothetical protein